MQYKHNKRLVPAARELRKNMTKQERRLWYEFLRGHPKRFIRQKIFGSYIADFYCPAARLIIELDGSQHYEADGMARDVIRTEFLEQYGVTVLRVPNTEINENLDGVCTCIDHMVNTAAEISQG